MGKRIALFAVMIGLALTVSVCADDNVQAVQEKLRDGGFYSGEIDGAYSSQLAAALTRYQIRKGLAVTGQLDVETSEALGAKPAVGPSTAATEQSSETWRRLRKPERRISTKAQETSSPTDNETPAIGTETPPRSAAAPRARTSSETTKPASAPPAPVSDTGSSGDGDISTERLRDYVGAFVLAGLDPHVGSEADFFADRVKYYDQGVIDREKIRNDLQDYAARWPERHFWFAGNIIIEPAAVSILIGVPQHRKRVRVTFPLRYELRNGATYSSGTINKTLVLEPVGDDLQIVAVSERKAE
jgi:peptidoglycan hydrolase-like protein with peptidoglycan-binding domain